MKNIAIVTGASGGFGLEFIKLLDRKDNLDEIWVLARNREKLEKIKDEYGDKIVVIPIDISDVESVKKFGEREELKNSNIVYLINNAGYAKFCSYEDLSVDESVNMINLNINGLVAMGLVCLPHMQRGSHLINIASQASFQPLPFQNIYSSTKSFVRHYTRALNVELKERGITATAVCPGWMKTGLYDRGLIGARRGTRNFVNMKMPAGAAKKALRDAERGRDMSVYSLYVKLCHVGAKLFPQKFVIKIWLRQQGEK